MFLNSPAFRAGREGMPDHPPFEVEIVGETSEPSAGQRRDPAVARTARGGRATSLSCPRSSSEKTAGRRGAIRGSPVDHRAARSRRNDLLGLLGPVSDRRDRPLRRRRGHNSLALRTHVRRAVSGGSRAPRARAGRRRRARRTRQLRRLDQLARPRALPDRPRGRARGRAGGVEVLRAAAARRRARALHRLRPPREHGDAVVAADRPGSTRTPRSRPRCAR